MRRRKEKTIQTKLFHNYFVLILVVVFLFLTLIFSYLWNVFTDDASQSMMQLTSSIQNELEMELEKANNLQKRIMFSDPFREALFSEKEEYQDTVKGLMLHRKLIELSDTVCGPDEYHNFQVNYWNTNGGCAGVGYNSFIKYDPTSVKKKIEFKKLWDGEKEKVISSPSEEEWAGIPVKVVSMFRVLEKRDASEKVILETQSSFESLEKIIARNLEVAEGGSASYDVVIVNEEKELVFVSEDLQEYKKGLAEVLFQEEKQSGKLAIENMSWMYKRSDSQFLDWNIWVLESEEQYKEPFVKMILMMLLFLGVIIIVLWKITYTLTEQMVTPIIGIHKKMKSLDFEHLENTDISEVDSDVKELLELDSAFGQMCQQLLVSKEKLQIAQSKELQSRFLAMQAQMNPHFLYNILAILKIMGKEVKSNSIVEVCTELSMMLRYISTSDRSPVTVLQEEKHTLNYLKLMKTRFQERLEYEIDIPDEMKDIPVPRLILQPLAENSIKYASKGRPPWKIQIRGWIDSGHWYLSVCDNGPGMTAEVKKDLEENMKASLIQKHSEESQIGGMGILNIYSRLVLVYGEEAYFRLNNLSDSGLEVTIGGSIDE